MRILGFLSFLVCLPTTAWSQEHFRCEQIKPLYGATALHLDLKPYNDTGSNPAERPQHYRLEVHKGGQLLISEKMVATHTDVFVTFESKVQNIRGQICFDDLNQTSILLKGRRYFFDCRPMDERF